MSSNRMTWRRLTQVAFVLLLHCCVCVGGGALATPDELTAVALPIQNQQGEHLGVVRVQRGQEAVDAAYRFAADHDLPHWFYEVRGVTTRRANAVSRL